MKLLLFSDGGARGNPGPAGSAALLHDYQMQELLDFNGKYLGHTTNNVAEYEGLLLGLEMAVEYIPEGYESITCCLDSELIVKQLNGEYKIKDSKMQALAIKAKELMSKFKTHEFKHIPRAQNSKADKLVNIIIDAAVKTP